VLGAFPNPRWLEKLLSQQESEHRKKKKRNKKARVVLGLCV